MKKSVFALFALSSLIFAGCEADKSYTREFEEAEMTFSKETASVAETGTKDAVTITTEETAIDVTVDYACKTWLSATLSGKTVTIEAIADNPTVDARTGRVSVFAGKNGKTIQKFITVTQEGMDPAKVPSLTVDPEKLTLANKSGDSKTVTITTNQSPVSVTVGSTGTEWISASIEGTTLTISSIQDNPVTELRSSYVTVTAGSLTATVSVSQEAGESKTCPYKVGDVYGTDGMIAYIDEDAKTALVMTLKQTICAFSTNTTTSTGVTDASVASGAAGTAAVQALSDYSATVYPAVAWVVAQGSGWYLPSIIELTNLANGIKKIDPDGGVATINAKLAAAGGDQITVGTDYLTIVEASASNEQMIRIAKDGDNGTSQGNYKKSGATRGVRGVKTITY